MNDIQQKLLAKIKSGELQMRPRWHFVLQAVLWASTTIAVALITIYLFSFLLFALHKSGLLFAPLLGWSGVMLFVVSSPWLLIIFVGIFLAALYLLVSHYSFSYKKPLVYSLVLIVLAVIALSSLIHQTTLHERAETILRQHGVPGLAAMYETLEDAPIQNIHGGTIAELSEQMILLEKPDGTTAEVVLSEQTKMPRGRILVVNDEIIVFGPDKDGKIEAFGVRPADERFMKARLRPDEKPPRIPPPMQN